MHDGQVSGDGTPGLGVLRTRTGSRPRLTDDDKLLVLAQSAVGSYLRYGAYPYAIAVREYVDGAVIEHRFVGLFTVAAMNADVLEIPTISRRVREALAMADSDPIHPGQLLLDVIQTIPRSELFTLSAERLLAMAKAVVDLGSATKRVAVPARRPAAVLRFLPGVSAPRPLHHGGAAADRGHPGPRIRRHPTGVHRSGQRITLGTNAFHGPAARGPDAAPVDVSEDNRIRIQALLSEAARTWADRLSPPRRKAPVGHADAEYYAAAFPEVYKQAVTPADAIDHIAIINELQDNSVKLVFAEARMGPRS